MAVGSVITARCQAGAWQATLNAKVAAHSFWHTCFKTRVALLVNSDCW